MNNKEFITELSSRLGLTAKACQVLVNGVLADISKQLEAGNAVTMGTFGTFDVKKKQERVIQNPVNGQRMLVPPKLVVNFKASTTLKDRVQKGGNK